MSRLSASDEGDNEVKPGTVLRSRSICFMTEVDPGIRQLGERLLKATRPVLVSNGVRYLQIKSVGSHSTSGRENEGKDVVGNKGSINNIFIYLLSYDNYN